MKLSVDFLSALTPEARRQTDGARAWPAAPAGLPAKPSTGAHHAAAAAARPSSAAAPPSRRGTRDRSHRAPRRLAISAGRARRDGPGGRAAPGGEGALAEP